jgi:putative nucleotidyltransferase with HDIG domain
VSDRHAAVWAAARPYMRSRKNDVHIPIVYACAERLLEHHPEADAEVVLLAALLHDVGWAVVDQEAIYRDAFGPGMWESDVRIAHEKEGARLAREVLEELEYPAALVDEVATIIDGHDSRTEALSRNDEIVKDADRLWRFSLTGVSVACDWFQMTPGDYAERLTPQLDRFFTAAGADMARHDLAATRATLKVDALAAAPA